MAAERQIYIVDDEPAVRRSIAFMLRAAGYSVESFDSGEAFLRAAPQLAMGCVLLDVRMPGMDGLEVQAAMRDRGIRLPVIIITGHGDIAIAVRAMKAGATDFIEKPFEKAKLLEALETACQLQGDAAGILRLVEDANTMLKVLTARERDVLDGLVAGLPNKTIAYDLGISPRTVEIHRANLMIKLGAKSLSDALRIAFMARVKSPDDAG
ncbi:MAG: response regulator FixJ [Polymorphobacter sp.]